MNPTRAALMTSLMLPTLALAQQYQGPEPAGNAESVRYDYAQVLRADPIYERVVYNEPGEDCDGSAVYERVGPRRASTGSVGGPGVGAVPGGGLGNQAGKGRAEERGGGEACGCTC